MTNRNVYGVGPYNADADGLVIWGDTGTLSAEQGSQYLQYVRSQTGPVVEGFLKAVGECGKMHCSGHGRCVEMVVAAGNSGSSRRDSDSGGASARKAGCRCFDGFTGTACSTDVTDPGRVGIPLSGDYGVTVDGENQVVYLATTDGGPQAPALTRRPPTNGSFVLVSLGPAPPVYGGVAPATSPRKVVVTAARSGPGSSSSAALRPAPAAGPLPLPTVSPTTGGGFAFEVTSPGRWVLELGGRYNQSTFAAGLMVFAEYDDPNPPDPKDPHVHFFAAGVHRLPLQPSWKLDGEGRGLALSNDSTVYLAPGAIVLGSLIGKNVYNVSIRGSGILAAVFLPGFPPPADMICASPPGCGHSSAVQITGGSNIVLEGITILHATGWNVHLTSLRRVSVRRVKIIGWKVWNDGIDLVSVQNATVDQCFIRSDDDAIAIKGMDPTMDTLNITVSNSVLFNQAHGNW